MYVQKNNPLKKVKRTKAKGGGTTKVCLPKAKIASMSKAERQKVIRAKRAAGKAGKYKRSSKSNVTGTSSGGSCVVTIWHPQSLCIEAAKANLACRLVRKIL